MTAPSHNRSFGSGHGQPSWGRNGGNAVEGPVADNSDEYPGTNYHINTNNNKCFLELLQVVRVMQENQLSFQ